MMALSEVKTYYPENLRDAVRLLSELVETRVLAGGTDLLTDIKEGLVSTKNLISIQKVKALKRIEIDNSKIRIGALVTPQKIASDSLIKQHIPALAFAAGSMAATQIRSMATIGGNICSAVPSADLPPSLIAANATVQLSCSESSRELSLAEFFTGPRETICSTHELLTFISIPLPLPKTGSSYQKLTLREANALAVASAAACLSLKNGIINRAVIVLGAVAPTPMLASKTSKYLIGKEPSQELFEKAGLKAKGESKPISDLRSSIWFRNEIIQVLTHRVLTEAWLHAQGKSLKKAIPYEKN